MIRSGSFVVAAALLSLILVPNDAAAERSCEITFRIGTSTPMLSASVFAIYQGAPGQFPGNATAVECELINNTIGQASDADQTSTLTLTVAGTPNPIQGPKNFARCTWIPTSRDPVVGDFNLTAQSGFNTSFPFPGPVNAMITISDIDCTGTQDTTTTTTSITITSTTQAPKVCGDFDGDGVVLAGDALGVLQSSVGIFECLLCVCDANGDGENTAVDALRTLGSAVGSAIDLICPGFCD